MTPGGNFDTATTVLNMARARVNDVLTTLQPTSGKLLDLTNANTQQLFNLAWRRAQDFLANKGYSALTNSVVIYGLPVAGSTDPATDAWLSWDGFWDGATFWSSSAYQLPTGFSHPLVIWERWNGTNAEFSDPPMEKWVDGYPSEQKTTSMRFWEWRNNAIYMPGSQVVEDLKIRYVQYMPDIVDVGSTMWWVQPVPIPRIAQGLSRMLCAELARSRDDQALEASETAKAEAALNMVFNLDVKADQRVNIQRIPRGRRGAYRYW
jgi:hypothetical protein